MKKLKLYLETSIWSYYYSEDIQCKMEATREFLQVVRKGNYDIYISRFVYQEINNTEDFKRNQLLKLICAYKPVELEVTSEAYKLADKYIKTHTLPRSSHTDAMHVATASIYNLDALISWNCRHLANLNRKSRINGINIQNNYKAIDIITPMEVMYYERR
ncbi:MAG: PIN domain-containing protein [Candidatus Eremiobacterota bacterium]